VTSSASSSNSTLTSSGSGAPDVLLNVPQLSVARIELDVDNLVADINLNANVANLVKINAGVAVGITKVNITIADVDAQLELIVRLGHLVDIVQRVFKSLDLNPLLITLLNDVTEVVDTVVGSVDGLLGSITQSGTTLNFIVDNLGNIVQSVLGATGQAVDTIVGNYQQNMTYTGVETALPGNQVQKQYEYGPLNALVNIIFNSLGQIVQATVAGTGSGTTGTAPPTNSAAPTGSTPPTSSAAAAPKTSSAAPASTTGT